jgi:hypothetical protein
VDLEDEEENEDEQETSKDFHWHHSSSPLLHYRLMGSLKKRRKAKINKHKRRKKLRLHRHKKRTWQK